ncbi:MAG: DsbA family protein [Phaeodactylibacter sp.]|uniref:DsbA family protein n=1 Tax=Phaeodactylibacter sp. TaxID=1940289 RepID=UPI0032ED12E8
MTRSFSAFGQEKPAFFYFYDALCGWCYGFSPVIHQLYQQYESEMDFEVLSGGMITGERVGRIGEVADYIKDAYRTVEQRTGVKFGQPFLEGTLAEGTAVFTSVPAATAMAIVKEAAPERQVEFAHLLQQAVYHDGIAPAVAEAYAPYAAKVGVHEEVFLDKMKALPYRKLAEQEFKITNQVGVRGFPTCFMKTGDQFHLISTGYQPLPELRRGVQKVLDMLPVNPNRGDGF